MASTYSLLLALALSLSPDMTSIFSARRPRIDAKFLIYIGPPRDFRLRVCLCAVQCVAYRLELVLMGRADSFVSLVSVGKLRAFLARENYCRARARAPCAGL